MGCRLLNYRQDVVFFEKHVLDSANRNYILFGLLVQVSYSSTED